MFRRWYVEEKDFWDRVDRNQGSESCWLWLGPKDTDGYGNVMYRRKHWKAHRLAWLFTYGEIPKGMFICHSCDTPTCVNPAHLWLGTNRANLADRDRKGRHAGSKKTHCPRGHKYTEANTRRNRGKRHCRTCERERSKARVLSKV